MKITVENKSCIGFDVRIGGIDDGQTPTSRLSYYTKVAEHVTNRMDNYYDANGLMCISWKFTEDNEDKNEVFIAVGWSMDEDVPSVDEIIQSYNKGLTKPELVSIFK